MKQYTFHISNVIILLEKFHQENKMRHTRITFQFCMVMNACVLLASRWSCCHTQSSLKKKQSIVLQTSLTLKTCQVPVFSCYIQRSHKIYSSLCIVGANINDLMKKKTLKLSSLVDKSQNFPTLSWM